MSVGPGPDLAGTLTATAECATGGCGPSKAAKKYSQYGGAYQPVGEPPEDCVANGAHIVAAQAAPECTPAPASASV